MPPFQAIKISPNVYWVGAIDHAIRDFHGYRTSRGTTYNAYLILGETPILIDTVKKDFFNEMLSRIKSIIDPVQIKYIISNHAEMDHSGSLLQAIDIIKPEKIFASKLGIAALRDHFDLNYPIEEIISGQLFTLGNTELISLETRMLHWPDSMFTFFPKDGVLFSQDAFGMHLATHKLFGDQHSDVILREESAKYFANILLPFSPLVSKLINNIPKLNLDIKCIAPDHGPIWNNPTQINWIISLWKTWAEQKMYRKAVITYDTMWGSTELMAKAIAEGLSLHGINISMMPLSSSHRSDIATELLETGALLIGSPTINQQLFPTLADTLSYLKGLKRKNLLGQVFGSYGWSGESINIAEQELKNMGTELVGMPAKSRYVPKADALNSCRALGEAIAVALKAKLENQDVPNFS